MKTTEDVNPEAKSDLFNQATTLQKYAGYLAILSAIVTFGMVVGWASSHDTDENYLGGLNWSKRVFNWHPVLMVGGFLLCFTTSLLSYRIIPLPKSLTKPIHGALNLGGLICVAVGLSAVVTSHNFKDHNKNHAYTANLYSNHSLMGIAAIVLFSSNYIMGFLHFFSGLLSDEMKAWFKPNHVFLGLFTLFLAFVAIESGVTELSTKLNCIYPVHTADWNPATRYHQLTDGCKLANGIGLMTLLTMFFAAYALIGPSTGRGARANGDDVLSKLHP